jgi:hypothetical protein
MKGSNAKKALTLFINDYFKDWVKHFYKGNKEDILEKYEDYPDIKLIIDQDNE